MKTRHAQSLICSSWLLASASFLTVLPAQSATYDPSAPLFHQVVPQPTGKNGYELLVLAADAFKSSNLSEKALEPGASLEFKRRVLVDRQVVRALKLLRDGLSMPIVSPRESVSFTTPLPELATFRGLARLLALQQYVFLADGRIADALANARVGLRFSRAVQTDTLISGLVGIAISTVCIDSMAHHLDQLSAGECAALYQICREWLAEPDPQLRILVTDRSATRNSVEEVKRELRQQGAASVADQFGKVEGWERLQAALKGFEATPAALDALFLDVDKRMSDHFDRVLKEMEKRPWERKPPSLDPSDLAGRLADALTPAYGKVDERYTRAAARVRLLACHCVIHRFRWEYDRLPPSLEALSLGELAIDPFTGQPIQYSVHGSRYSLAASDRPPIPAIRRR